MIIDAHLHIGQLSDSECFGVDDLLRASAVLGVELGFIIPIVRMGDVVDDFDQYCEFYNELVDRK